MNLLNNKNLKWRNYKDDENFDYPIDYSDAAMDGPDLRRLLEHAADMDGLILIHRSLT